MRALGGQRLEAEAQARDLQGGAERDREAGERAARHQQARDRAVLDLDVVDPGRGAGEHARDRPEHAGQEVVGVDRLAEQGAAELGRLPPRQGTS